MVYGKKTVIPIEYIVSRLRIDVINKMTYVGAIEEILSQLLQLEEYRFIVGYQQWVDNEQ